MNNEQKMIKKGQKLYHKQTFKKTKKNHSNKKMIKN